MASWKEQLQKKKEALEQQRQQDSKPIERSEIKSKYRFGGFWLYHEEFERLGLEEGITQEWQQRRLE